MRTEADAELLGQTARELAVDQRVRVWLVRLDDHSTHDVLEGILSDDERVRAAAYPGATRARRFIRARGSLRFLLGHLLHRPPAELVFEYGRDGKPSLAADPAGGSAPVHFNVSHARDLALMGFAERRRIGVDLAWAEGEARQDAVANRFFSLPERAAYASASPDERRTVFSRIWVRKEAYLKGRGEGISERIYETDFSGPLDAEGRVAGASGGIDQASWIVRDVRGIDEGFAGAVALERVGR